MCAKGFRTIRSLKTHLFKQHGVDFDEKEKSSMLKDIERRPKMKPVDPECLKCNRKTFRNIEDFNDHVLICYGRRLLSIDFICNKKNCSRKKWNSAEVLHYHLFSGHFSQRLAKVEMVKIRNPDFSYWIWSTPRGLVVRPRSFCWIPVMSWEIRFFENFLWYHTSERKNCIFENRLKIIH